MKRTGTGRVLAALFLGVMRGVYVHFNQLRALGHGREAFLADQGHRFDSFAAYHSAGSMLVAEIILTAVAVGLYEVIAAGITNILPPSSVEE